MASCVRLSSANDLSGMVVFDSFIRQPGAAPHAQVGGEDAAAFAVVFGGDFREIHPWHGGLRVVVAMPVVVEPEGIEPFPGSEVSCALEHIALGAEVVDVLQGGPEDAEAADEQKVFPCRCSPEPDPCAVEQENGNGLQADEAEIARVERIE